MLGLRVYGLGAPKVNKLGRVSISVYKKHTHAYMGSRVREDHLQRDATDCRAEPED